MAAFTDLEDRISSGHSLNGFDTEAVETVAGLIRRVRDAERIIATEGPIIEDEKGMPVEHPAVKVERMASAEIRGWVKERPDLFGKREASGVRRRKFEPKIVGG
ncbi:P27 family phage terminase small subunit [Corynebacterium mastitidis]|uniref:P27 family phage terminase small subunit n=1 Tax=Corynebacterium mastitidis TaxID=161890 RepID=UPI00036CACFB|nr:P27 family phage terminase small subunit [Corynebacterium mastitidis]